MYVIAIAIALEQYALARGMCDIEYTVVLMTDGVRRTLENGDEDLEAYFRDHRSYWASHGWIRSEPVPGKWGLVQVGRDVAEAALSAELIAEDADSP
jgi:hypothetical protein